MLKKKLKKKIKSIFFNISVVESHIEPIRVPIEFFKVECVPYLVCSLPTANRMQFCRIFIIIVIIIVGKIKNMDDEVN